MDAFLNKRRKVLMTVAGLYTITTIVDGMGTFADRESAEIFTPQTTEFLYGIDIYIFAVHLLQYLCILGALFTAKDYRLSKRWMLASGGVFLILPLIVYLLPLRSFIACSPSFVDKTLDGIVPGLGEALTPLLAPYCSTFVVYVYVLFNLQTSLPTLIIFPAILNGCHAILAMFGEIPLLSGLKAVIAFGFLPLFTIAAGMAYQFYGYVSTLTTYAMLSLFLLHTTLSDTASRFRKAVRGLILIGIAVSGYFLVKDLDVDIVPFILKAIPRYYFSLVLYTDLGISYLKHAGYMTFNQPETADEEMVSTV
jgi:hypothetical protein